MRVVVAPDSFGGTLSAVEAARAIAAGWARAAPADELDVVPLADGGPGFVDVLSSSLGGELVTVPVRDPCRRRVSATLLAAGDTVYVETAHACGIHLVAPPERDPLGESTAGVGDLLEAARDLAPSRIVAGLGGSATNDGGAGMLAALGFALVDAAGAPLDLESGPQPLARLEHAVAPQRWGPLAPAAVELVAATDVDSPLVGPSGATAVFGRQKGAGPRARDELETCLGRLAEVAGRELPGAAGAELVSGSGAAGGLGYGMLLLGGRIESGCQLVLTAVGMDERLAGADLVLTGEGSFDDQSLHGKVVSGVARTAREHGVDCLVLAGMVSVSAGPDALAAAGISAAYGAADEAGSLEASLAEPATYLGALAERVARCVHEP